jgi:hypothetical protein
MKKYTFLFLMLILTICHTFAQTGQLTIPRVAMMPDLPTPFQIRDWNAVAVDYDNFVFDLDKTGQYLPLSRLGTTGQFNYPGNTPLFLDSYVGADGHLNQAEAINIMPAVVGASLAGIDKSNQNGMNWVGMTKDFFNLKNGQNVYLNNYSTTSGNDWWYDMMPNLYFYQLKYLYPEAAPEYDAQFTSVADRWLWAVNQLGGSTMPWEVPYMNYRAYNLATGQPLTAGVPEPESAGSIAWLLYNAYTETGERKYIEGAQLAMDFLAGWETNPSYELQLPYGTLAAARMNAVEGTNYPIQKMLDWCFDRGALREWGSIVGNWNGYDVSGLIGEANDGGDDYAFVMNGFQQAAALAPLPKYDKRYAKAIAKWLLNITNASRLFYWNALPENLQDSYAWALVNDPTACIPHESMKEVWLGKTPFATGDAIRGGWAETNLSLYSGSSVGYLAAVVNQTNVPEILQIDLNKTDFYGGNTFSSWMYFNPTATEKQVTLTLSPGSFGVYESITETILFSAASGSVQITVPAGEVRLIRLYVAGQEPEAYDGKLYIGDDVLDYHYQYDYSENLRIKALSVEQRIILVNSEFSAWCEPGNVPEGSIVQYSWFLNDELVTIANGSVANLSAPALPGTLVLKCSVSANGQIASDTLHIQVVDRIPVPPVLNGIQAESPYTATGNSNTFTALVEPAAGEILNYEWSVSTGTLFLPSGNTVSWQASNEPTVAEISVVVTNQDMLSAETTTGALVKDTTLSTQEPIIYYPFDTDNQNAASNRFHATVSGATKTEDARGKPATAYRFTSGSNIIYTENDPDLNFTDAVSLSCWVKCEQFGSERFIFSHGSWQQRYKLSITPEGFLRWTVKTSTGVADLDGSSPIELNRYYHLTVLYTGYSMEMYVDGDLDAFKAFSGEIQPSTKPLTIGRMDNVETLYSLRGSVDEVKLWDREIPIPQIEQLKNQWFTPYGIEENDVVARIYPNPSDGNFAIEFTNNEKINGLTLTAVDGSQVAVSHFNKEDDRISVVVPQIAPGLYLLSIALGNGKVVNRKVLVR